MRSAVVKKWIFISLAIFFTILGISFIFLKFYILDEKFIQNHQYDIISYVEENSAFGKIQYVNSIVSEKAGDTFEFLINDFSYFDDKSGVEIFIPELKITSNFWDVVFSRTYAQKIEFDNASLSVSLDISREALAKLSVSDGVDSLQNQLFFQIDENTKNLLNSPIMLAQGANINIKQEGLPKKVIVLPRPRPERASTSALTPKNNPSILSKNKENQFTLPERLFSPFSLSQSRLTYIEIQKQVAKILANMEAVLGIPIQANFSDVKLQLKDGSALVKEKLGLQIKGYEERKIQLAFFSYDTSALALAFTLLEAQESDKDVVFALAIDKFSYQQLKTIGFKLPIDIITDFDLENIIIKGSYDGKTADLDLLESNIKYLQLAGDDQIQTASGARIYQSKIGFQGNPFLDPIKFEIASIVTERIAGSFSGDVLLNSDVEAGTKNQNSNSTIHINLTSNNTQFYAANGLPSGKAEVEASASIYTETGVMYVEKAKIEREGQGIAFNAKLPNKEGNYELSILGGQVDRDMIVALYNPIGKGNNILDRYWQQGKLNLNSGNLSFPAEYDVVKALRDGQAKIELQGAFTDGQFNVPTASSNLSFLTQNAKVNIGGGQINIVSENTSLLQSSDEEQIQDIALSDTQITVSSIFSDIPRLSGKIYAIGDNKSLLTLLNIDPLKLASNNGLEISSVLGSFVLDFQGSLPLTSNLNIEDVVYTAKGEINNFSMQQSQSLPPITGGNFNFVATSGKINVLGEAMLLDAPAKLSYEQRLRDKASKNLRIEGVLSTKLQALYGINLGKITSGNIPAIITYNQNQQSDAKTQLQLDFTPLNIDLQEIAYKKPLSEPAKLSLEFKQEKALITLEDVNYVSSGLNFNGDITYNQDNKNVNFNFPKFALGEKSQISLKGSYSGNGNIRANITGQEFNAGPILKNLLRPSQNKKEARLSPLHSSVNAFMDNSHDHHVFDFLNTKQKNVEDYLQIAQVEAVSNNEINQSNQEKIKIGLIEITAKIKRIIGLNQEVLDDATLVVNLKNEVVNYADIQGSLSGRHLTSISINPSNKKDVLNYQVTTQNAGKLLRFVDIYNKVIGGKLIWRGEMSAKNLALKNGRLEANDFIIENEKTLKKIFGSRDIRAEDRVINNAISVNRFSGNFSAVPNTNTYHINDVVFNNKSIGLSMKGQVNFTKRLIGLYGVYTPLYDLNNFFRKLPVIGSILTNKENEGLIGVTYKIEGSFDDPSVIVNAGSIAAPGFLRSIFEFSKQDIDVN